MTNTFKSKVYILRKERNEKHMYIHYTHTQKLFSPFPRNTTSSTHPNTQTHTHDQVSHQFSSEQRAGGNVYRNLFGEYSRRQENSRIYQRKKEREREREDEDEDAAKKKHASKRRAYVQPLNLSILIIIPNSW